MKPGEIDLCDPDNYADGFPFAYFEVLRREAPVYWHEPSRSKQSDNSIAAVDEGFFVLSKYQDVVHVSRTPEVFSSEIGTSNLYDPDPELLDSQRQILINMDPPKHVKYRRLVSRVFTPKAIAAIEPAMRAHAKRIVEEIADKSECEFVTEVACELPLLLICEFLGFPVEDRQKIFRWSNAYIGRDDPDYVETVAGAEQAQLEFYMYNSELAAKKLEQPDETLISRLVNEELDGEKLTPHEVNLFILLLAVAGNETTRNATSHGMRLLGEYPEQAELLLSDLDRYLAGFIEEALRFSPPVMHFRRTATQDTEIRGVAIPSGSKVVVYYPSANRDEDMFSAPNDFDITRDPNPHLSFGIGEHFCLGANLARMELTCIFSELLQRLPSLRAMEPPKRMRGNFIDGIKSMTARC